MAEYNYWLSNGWARGVSLAFPRYLFEIMLGSMKVLKGAYCAGEIKEISGNY